MTRSKKIFVAFAIAFLLVLAYLAYDISSRTTFPGPRHPSESTDGLAADTLTSDSVGAH